MTETAMHLGYGSTSAFVYAFRTDFGSSPQAYMHEQVSGRPRQ
ncbi:AraC family transcriptional regulator [Methylobacterium sp. ARG-1]|nr:AraC family transcriptional regulator [Methylobacterium sp. ARG-1]